MTSLLQDHRILAVHPSPDLYGSDRVFVDAVRAFQQAEAKVDVVLPISGRLDELMATEGVRSRVVPFPVLRKALLSPRPAAKLLWSTPASLRHLVRLIKVVRPDVIYVSTLTAPHWLLAAQLAGVPSVCHVHELEAGLPRIISSALLAPLALANAVIVNSVATGAFLLDNMPSVGKRAVLAYNGFTFRPQANLGQCERSGFRLALVGRLSPRKGQDVAIDALARLVHRGYDVTLELVGDAYAGYEWYEQDLRVRSQALGLEDRVLFSGFTADPKPFYEASDIVLVPSRTEPFGNVAVEGSASGRPVVASSVGGLPEIVEDGRTGLLVSPEDTVGLADAIQQLIDSPDWAAELGAAGARRVRERFSLEQFEREVTQVAASAISASVR